MLAKSFNLFWFFFVQLGQLLFRLAIRAKQFIQLGMYRLSVAVFRALDEQRDPKRYERRYSMPIQRIAVKNQPEHRVYAHRCNGPWT